MRRRPLALLLGVAIALTPLPLHAQAPDPELAQGMKQLREGDFEGAVTTLEAVVRRLSANSSRSRDLVQAYLNLGVAYVALDQPEPARARFREALTRDRNLKLSPAEHSPKVLAVFEEARREAREASGGKGGARVPLIVAGVAAAAAGVILATRAGSDETPTFSGARFASTVVVCPDNSVALPIPVLILVEARAGTSSLTIGASATLRIVDSADRGEIGFGSNRATNTVPPMLSARARSTLQIETSLQCDNGPGDSGRWNEWSGQVTLTTSVGVFTVETVDRLRVNIP